VFEAASSCGCCQSRELRFRHRKAEKFDYYELVCSECGARFQFGQHQEGGGLFPKRRGEDGSSLPNHGWSKWDGRRASSGGSDAEDRAP